MLEQVARDQPQLSELEQRVRDLEGELGQAQSRVAGLQAKVAQARDADIDATAKALNASRRPPPAQEPKLVEQLQDAERELAIVRRRHELVTGERSAFLRDHRDELVGMLAEAREGQARQVADAAQQALDHLLLVFQAEDDARSLLRTYADPAPEPDPHAKAGPVTLMLGPLSRANFSGAGGAAGSYQRGEVEQMLRHLINLRGEGVTEVGEVPPEDDDPAAVLQEPGPASDARNGAA